MPLFGKPLKSLPQSDGGNRKEGLEMETYATPFIKTAIGIAIILIALAILALGITPLANVLIELMK